MRKIALLLAAALMVSAPVIMTDATDTHAAAAKKEKATKSAKAEPAAKQGGQRPYDFNSDPNTAFIRALSDALSGKQGSSNRSAAPGGAKGKAAAPKSVASSKGGGASTGGAAGGRGAAGGAPAAD